MARRKSKSPPIIPADITTRRQKATEQARQKQEQRRALDAQRDRLVAAGNLVQDLGQDFELAQRADKQYLKQWIKAIADYKAMLGAWPNARVPPAGLGGDIWQVAVNVFLASDTDPGRAAAELAGLAAELPDFAMSVARCLRSTIRRVCEGYLSCPVPQPPVQTAQEGEGARLPNVPDETLANAGKAPATDKKAPATDKITQAIGLATKHPDWTTKRIAEEVGCSTANLSQSPRWRAVRRAIRGSGQQGMLREGKDRRAKDRGGRHRGTNMDQYADSRDADSRGEQPGSATVCACGDPAGMDANGMPYVHEGKPRCLDCWKELTAPT